MKIKTYNILYIGVFSITSTNTPQAQSLKNLGHDVTLFEYRSRNHNELNFIKNNSYDILLIAKGSGLSNSILHQFKLDNPSTIIAYWFMDPLSTFITSYEFIEKCQISDIVFVDKISVYNCLKSYNINCYHVCEGYPIIDTNITYDEIYEASFIGNIYTTNRHQIIQLPNVTHVNNCYNADHDKIVKQSKININSCTNGDASDRVYKILSSGGFLLTDKWIGLDEMKFEDKKHLVIYNNINELRELISFYLNNDTLRKQIAKNGFDYINSLNISVDDWATNIINKIQLL